MASRDEYLEHLRKVRPDLDEQTLRDKAGELYAGDTSIHRRVVLIGRRINGKHDRLTIFKED